MKKVIDTTRCNTRVWGNMEGTARWMGLRPCKGKIAVKTIREDGSTIACYCARHAPKAQPGLVVVPVVANA